ncbi:hypothetical protein Tco_1392460 [Tanacetum coccineum]
MRLTRWQLLDVLKGTEGVVCSGDRDGCAGEGDSLGEVGTGEEGDVLGDDVGDGVDLGDEFGDGVFGIGEVEGINRGEVLIGKKFVYGWCWESVDKVCGCENAVTPKVFRKVGLYLKGSSNL